MIKKKTLSLVLAVCMIFGFAALLPAGAFESIPFASGTVSAEKEKDKDKEKEKEMITGIRINKAYLKAGEKLSVENPNGYLLKFFVGDKQVSTGSLTLKAAYYEKWIGVRAYNGNEMVCGDKVYFSKLPVIYINTDDGKDVTVKEEYKDANMVIQDNTKQDEAMYSGKIEIKGRGNTTWNLPKKPYKIKLDKKADLFGMGKSKHWVLLANYIDESLLRNRTAEMLSEQLGLETMLSVSTDVVLNGVYVGNYQLCEHIRIGKTRVDIFDWEDEAEKIASAVSKAVSALNDKKDELEDALVEDLSWVSTGKFTFDGVTYTISDYCDYDEDVSGGYLFELSSEYDELSKFTTPGGLKVMIKAPEYLKSNSDMMFYAQRYWTSFESAIKAEDGYVKMAEGTKHYTELADLDSMVAYWLEMEIMGNNDAVWKSRYAYKDKGELLKFGPPWDFDYYSGSMLSDPIYDTRWVLSQKGVADNFFKEFLDDPLFFCKATEKYWEIRPYLEDLIKKGGILDQQIAYLSESGKADGQVWDRSVTYPGKARGFQKDAQALKNYLTKRVAWLDKQFETDRVLLLSTYNPHSAFPYTKSDDKVVIQLKNAKRDKQSQHAQANGIIGASEDLQTKITVKDKNTKSVSVYVNGILCKTVALQSSKAELTIDSSMFTQPVGTKNVITVIGRDAKGLSTYKNYSTVIRKQYKCASGAHKWTKQTYSWDSENKTCTAEAVCSACGEKLSQTANASYSQKTAPICEKTGVGVYTASFADKTFTKQTKTVTLAMSEHKWSEWSETKKATASEDGVKTRTCEVCGQTQEERIPATGEVVHRYGGANRYQTAAMIANDSAVFSDSKFVLLASGTSYADALAGVPLAKAYNAPILLTDKDILPNNTLEQIKALKNVTSVIILGGTGVISEGVEKQIQQSGYVTERIAGATRFETAAKIAQRLEKVTGDAPKSVFFVCFNNFPDALSASAAAAVKGSPILYTRQTGELDSATQEYLKSVNGKTTSAYVIGGEGVISESVRKFKIEKCLGVQAQRVAGADRYLTSVAVNKVFRNSFRGNSICIATGKDFPDALSGSVLAAITDSPVLLVGNVLSASQKNYLKGRQAEKIHVFGGTSAVSEKTVQSIKTACGK